MKKLLPFLVCIFLFAKTSVAQTYTSSCTITPAMNTNFKMDVSRLCIARLNETNSPYKDSIEIQQSLYDTIMRVMAIMNNMQPSALKDTINNLFFFTNFSNATPFDYESDSSHIHTVGSGSLFSTSSTSDVTRLKNIIVYIDSNISWVRQWANGNTTNTGNAAMDSFIMKYGISISKLNYSFMGWLSFILQTTSITNTNALIQNVPTASSFAGIYPEYYLGDAQRLIFEYQSTGIVAHYLTGCGDCIAGCLHQKIWHFYIPHDSCVVHYLGSNFYSVLSPTEIVCLRGVLTPIEFGNITATKQGEQNTISFTALTEVNIKQYQIERSTNSNNFSSIATIAANNKNNSQYVTLDKSPLSGNNYYRIKAIENNGTVSYSKTVVVKNEEIKFNVFPNPAKDVVTVSSKESIKEVRIVNQLGQVVQQLIINNQSAIINVQEFAKGLYLLKITTNKNNIFNEKLLVQ